MVELSEQELQDLYTWIDEIPLSRPKKNISRDFSDAGIQHCQTCPYISQPSTYISYGCRVSKLLLPKASRTTQLFNSKFIRSKTRKLEINK